MTDLDHQLTGLLLTLESTNRTLTDLTNRLMSLEEQVTHLESVLNTVGSAWIEYLNSH